MEARQGTALQHVVQRSRKKIFNAPRTDVLHRCQPQLEQSAAVGCQNLTVGVHRQLALVQGKDKFWSAMEMQRMRLAKASIDQAVFNHARRHAQHHKQVLLHHAGTAAHIKHRRDLAGGVIHRHGRAGELRELMEKMVLTVNPHRACFSQAGAHAVGTRHFLAPDATEPQTERSCIRGKFRRRHHVDDHTIGIGQHHGRLDVAQLLEENGHLVAGAGDEVGQPRATRLQVAAFDKVWRAGFGRIQTVLVDAAAPGLGYHIALLLAQSALHLRQNSMRMVAGVLHHRQLPVEYLTGTMLSPKSGKNTIPVNELVIL